MASFDSVWVDTKTFEAGFQNSASDSGNYCKGQLIGTKYGISAIGYAQYLGGTCPTVMQVQNLTESTAKQIAKAQYWDNIHGDSIKSQALAHLIFDITFGGSSGPLQVRQAINQIKPGSVTETKSTGLTDKDVQLINSLPEKDLFDRIVAIRKNWLVGNTYQEGLTNRLLAIQAIYANALANPMAFAKKHQGVIIISLSLLALGGIGWAYFKN